MGSPWRWRSGCWMTRARWNIWLVSNYRKCVNMSNVKCVKSEALTIMIKGWSYLSKGAILVASSTCGKNTNIKRNAKAKASVTFLKINHAKIQHKQVSSCDSARPTKTIIIINFVRLRHLFHWSWSSKHLQCQYPQIRNNQSSGSKSDQAKSLTPVQVGDLQPKQHYLGDHMILLEKINKIYIIFLIRTHWGWKYSKDMSSIKFRNKGWKRTIWSWRYIILPQQREQW